MSSRIRIVSLALSALLFLPIVIVGQNIQSVHWHQNGSGDLAPTHGHETIIDVITRLYKQGDITKTEALSDIVLIFSDSESRSDIHNKYSLKLDKGIVSFSEAEMFKCLTPTYIEFEDVISLVPGAMELFGLSGSSDLTQFNKYNSDLPVTHQFHFTSASGRFVISYDTTGALAVPTLDSNNSGIPDYVELTAVYADSSFNYLVEQLGFKNPLKGDSPIQIKYHNGNYYGNADTANNINIHRNFIGFPPNFDGNMVYGSLKVTIAHELKHLIQFATTRVTGNSLHGWIEVDATMTEEVVFPTVKDYLNYLPFNSIFSNSQRSVPNAYYHATFALYFRERFGDEFWVNVWERLAATNSRSMLGEMSNELRQLGFSLDQEIVQNYLWHFASGTRYSPGFGFADAELYPAVTTELPSNLPLPVTTSYSTLNRRAAKFFIFDPDSQSTEKIVSGIFRENGQMQLGIIGFFKDRTVDTGIITNSSLETQEPGYPFNFDGLMFDWTSDDLESVGIVIVNNSDATKSAQIISGTELAPSAVIYGDINNDYSTTIMDAELLLDYYINLANSPNLSSPLSQVKADVSGNGTVSAFDAALILKHEQGVISEFPADQLQEIFVPGLSWFRPSNAEAPLAKVSSQKQPLISTSADSLIRFTSYQSNEPNDDKLRVRIHLDDSTFVYSAYLELHYDAEALSYVEFNTSESGENEEISRFHPLNGVLKLAIARSVPFENDTIVEVVFTPLKETNVTVTLAKIHLDESWILSPSLQIAADVAPGEGVGIPDPIEIPSTSRLLNNYPNPFNPVTNIPFELSGIRNVRIQILDVTGRVVNTLTDQTYPIGHHQIVFNATNLSSGVYIVRMISQDPISKSPAEYSTKRILLIK